MVSRWEVKIYVMLRLIRSEYFTRRQPYKIFKRHCSCTARSSCLINIITYLLTYLLRVGLRISWTNFGLIKILYELEIEV